MLDVDRLKSGQDRRRQTNMTMDMEVETPRNYLQHEMIPTTFLSFFSGFVEMAEGDSSKENARGAGTFSDERRKQCVRM